MWQHVCSAAAKELMQQLDKYRVREKIHSYGHYGAIWY